MAPYIFPLNPDYVAARSLRSLRSNKNVVFSALAEFSYFSVDFGLKIFLILNNDLWSSRFRMSWGFN